MSDAMKNVLVTGGAGYVGSHTVIEIIAAGYTPIIVDNMHNANEESIRRVEELVGKKITFYNLNILDKAALNEIFQKHKIYCVIHFAALKAVGESMEIPLAYYKNNVGGTIALLEVMKENKCVNFVFSSSATVYGTPEKLPIDENHPTGGCTNPYGKSKYFIEEILKDLCFAEKDWNVMILRYFNPVGAHKSGRIGEDPNGIPNNLMPFIAQVAVGRRPHLNVFGNDYDTPDGTGVRDYIHVVDLAIGHVSALKKIDENCGLKIYNLGTGVGYSVLQMAAGFEKASGKKIPYKIADRRPGDIGSVYADCSLALNEMGWKAERGLDEMCADNWRWQSQNPFGFKGKE
ncbi:UDP-glucose 4-epimerase-like isoform X2 [Tubulanus polymorphus]|uniref:UDP-glucose 4-epimerase-like isoform X2 n=1 Tax=Tubulanus polymorphus TaxID=672921 RepID=UPI003DA31876